MHILFLHTWTGCDTIHVHGKTELIKKKLKKLKELQRLLSRIISDPWADQIDVFNTGLSLHLLDKMYGNFSIFTS